MYEYIQKQDPESFGILNGEEQRQREGIELVPSENYISRPVKEALASGFTNKYSEGYPGARYYGGQEFTDKIESLAIERVKKLFKASFANVQPLSGAPANLAVYATILNPGDPVMGMDLSHGGHLTHGHPATLSSKLFNFVTYGMKNPETGEIDYDEVRAIALREKPKLIIAGFSAYTRDLDYKKFVEIAHEVGAYTMADIAHTAGLIAAGVLRNPFDDGFDIITTTTHKTLRGPRGGVILTRDDESLARKVDKAVFPGIQGGPHMNTIAAKAVAFGEALHVSFKQYAEQVLKNAKAMEEVCRKEGVRMVGGGTSNHLLLVDVATSFSMGGREAQHVLDSVGITINKNAIANDERSAVDPSGIRFGAPAITTRGMKESDAARVTELMLKTLRMRNDGKTLPLINEEVAALAKAFPIPDTFF